MKENNTFYEDLQKIYLKHFKGKLNPVCYFEDSVDSGVLYLLKNASVLENETFKQFKKSLVPFSVTHPVSIDILCKIAVLYGIKEIRLLEDTSISLEVPDLINNTTLMFDKYKKDLNAYLEPNIRRYIFLLKKTRKNKYLKVLKKAKFLVPVKINSANEFESLITTQTVSTTTSKDENELHNRELTKNLLMVFSDTYSFDNYKSTQDKDLSSYRVILMSYAEIKKHIYKHHSSGIYINNSDSGIFNKNLNYILPIKKPAASSFDN